MAHTEDGDEAHRQPAIEQRRGQMRRRRKQSRPAGNDGGAQLIRRPPSPETDAGRYLFEVSTIDETRQQNAGGVMRPQNFKAVARRCPSTGTMSEAGGGCAGSSNEDRTS